MWVWIAIGVGTPAGVIVLGFLALAVVLRTRYRPGLAVIRRFNRRVTNRQAMKTAGQPGAGASVVRHIGRTSGKAYETPVGITEAGDDFLITLPYGSGVDWLKNVAAAGSAEVIHEGDAYRVTDPEVVTAASVAQHLSGSERFGLRLLGVNQILRLRKTGIEH